MVKIYKNMTLLLFKRHTITALLFFTIFSSYAQNKEIVTGFINKNSIGLRSVQKNSINSTDINNAANFKELLKLHLASIKLVNKNTSESNLLAAKVREKTVEFLSKNTKSSLEYYALTDEESKVFNATKQPKPVDTYFTANELKLINSIDVKNPSLFNSFEITIK